MAAAVRQDWKITVQFNIQGQDMAGILDQNLKVDAVVSRLREGGVTADPWAALQDNKLELLLVGFDSGISATLRFSKSFPSIDNGANEPYQGGDAEPSLPIDGIGKYFLREKVPLLSLLACLFALLGDNGFIRIGYNPDRKWIGLRIMMIGFNAFFTCVAWGSSAQSERQSPKRMS